ncbi:hypothetical protein PVAP13_2NG548009 [Panicum virgatum]|uniref:Uncharacterized protein n=1 Tax=Panicum virgatum TaxID=38727 RepID=A0A8T0VNU3_PANVG|nr:hypothetical protein PVAP13_2NG548009 [Panicum virgatum]
MLHHRRRGPGPAGRHHWRTAGAGRGAVPPLGWRRGALEGCMGWRRGVFTVVNGAHLSAPSPSPLSFLLSLSSAPSRRRSAPSPARSRRRAAGPRRLLPCSLLPTLAAPPPPLLPPTDAGPWRSAHASGATRARRLGAAAGGGRRPGAKWRSGARAPAGQGRGEAHRPSAAWGAAARRRGDDIRRRWRWSFAEEDLRKGNRPGEDRNRSRRGRVSSLRTELKGASPEPERDRDAPAVGRRLLPMAAPCFGPHSEVGEQASSPHPVEHTHASAAAATIAPRRPPAKFA